MAVACGKISGADASCNLAPAPHHNRLLTKGRVMASSHSIGIPPPLPVIEGIEIRRCPGFPAYCVGDDGSFRSCKWCGKYTATWRQLPGRIVRGYRLVTLRKEGHSYSRFLHRLVLEAFVGPCPKGMVACHFPDRSPLNCRLDNIRWDTDAANHNDSRIHGTLLIGSKNPLAKLNETIVADIRRLNALGVSQAKLARDFGIDQSNVSYIVRRKTWTHVT
jgi:hypothetical protein